MSLVTSKKIVALGIIAFLAISFWSLSSMSMDMSGHMVNCPFMADSSSFCQMTLSEHISQWQQSFMAIKERRLAMFLLLVVALSFVAVLTIDIKSKEKLRFQRFRHYLHRYESQIKLFDHLALAFSDGLIRSKIYA